MSDETIDPLKDDHDKSGRQSGSPVSDPFPWTLELALSGGGFRASAYALGALLYVVHGGLNAKVKNIASVSGSSITNAFVACNCDFKNVETDEFRNVVSQLARALARRGLIQRWESWTWVAAIFIGVMLLATVSLWAGEGLNEVWLGKVEKWRAAFIIGLLVLILLFLFELRSWPVGGLIKSIIPANISLGDLQGSDVDHVFCATDLKFGQPFFLSTADGGRIFSQIYGRANASTTKIVEAVRASAAFPPLIPFVQTRPTSIWAYEQGFSVKPNPIPGKVWLTDGGAFNNFGTEWHQLRRELHVVQAAVSKTSISLPDWQRERYGQVQLVIDASVLPQGKRLRLLRIPGIGFFAYAFRLVNLIYNGSLAGRSDSSEYIALARMKSFPRKWLARHQNGQTHRRLFEESTKPYDPVIDSESIEQGALRLFVSHSTPFGRMRAHWDLFVTHGDRYQQLADWEADKKKAATKMVSYWPWTGETELVVPKEYKIGTKFQRLGEKTTTRLIIEGYLKTREVLFLSLGFVGPPLPDPDWFTSLCKDSQLENKPN